MARRSTTTSWRDTDDDTSLEMDSTPSTLTTKTAWRFFTNEEVCITCTTRHGRVRRRVVLVVECVQRQDTTCAERDSRGAFGANEAGAGVGVEFLRLDPYSMMTPTLVLLLAPRVHLGVANKIL